jgi:hypothetical protein
MTENTIILFAGAAIVAIIGLAFPWSGRKNRQPANKKYTALIKLRHPGSYRGVTIRPGKCPVARRYSGKPYSFDTAPPLPLPGCNALRCSCNYHGLLEHRNQARRNPMNRRETVRFDAERPERRSGERRHGYTSWRDPGD